MLKVRMGYPGRASEKEILRDRGGRAAVNTLVPAMEANEVVALQCAVEHVRVEESLLDYALEIVERTRKSEHLSLGVSTRGAQMLHRAAQAHAFLQGREFCSPDDFKRLVVPVFAHRVVVNTKYLSTQKKSEQAENILRELVETVRVPL